MDFNSVDIILLFIYLLMPLCSNAQKIHYENFKIKDGLPSNTIYDLLEDRNGVLWIATDKGVSVYDGVVFKNYTTDNGLIDNDVIDLLEDSLGRIWFIHFSTGPGYYYKGKFYGPHNDSFLRKVHQSKEQNRLIFFAINVDSKIVYFKIKKNSRNLLVSIDDKKEIEIGDFIGNNGVGLVLMKVQKNTLTLVAAGSSLEINGKNRVVKQFKKYTSFYDYNSLNNGLYGFTPDTNKLCWFNFNNNKVEYLPINETGITYFSKNQNALYIIQKNRILITDLQATKIIRTLPIDFDANVMIVMQNGDIFCKNNINGLYLIKKNASLNIFEGSVQNKNASSLFQYKDKLIVGSDGNGVFELFNNNNKRLDPVNLGLVKFIGISSINDQLFIASEQGLFRKIGTEFKGLKKESIKDLEADKNEIFIATPTGIYTLKDDKSNDFEQLVIGRATSVCRKDNNTIWYGMLKGLSQIKILNGEKEIKKIETNTPIDYSYISDIKRDTFGNMWIATSQNGLFFYSINSGFISVKEIGNPILFNICKKIFIDIDQIVWVAHSKGLTQIQSQWMNQKMHFTILNYTKLNGLPDNGVNDVIRYNNQLVVASESGVFIFKPTSKQKFNVKTILSEVSINGQVHDQQLLNLPYWKNNIKLKFSASFINSGGNKYYFKYRVLGINKKWEKLAADELQLFDLKPGNYKLEIAALDINDNSGEILELIFTIRQPWYKSVWFVVICSLSLLFLLYLFYRYKKKQIENRKNLIEMELKVLRGQMKPHFIFNSLNSIQQNLLLKDFETTSNYITKFSKLLRNNLHYSSLEKINLKEEVDFLNNYLELEIYRFHNLFTYDFEFINIDNKEDIKLPAFMIQPVLENCIKHGFKFTKEGGKINLIFEQQSESLLKVTILDNGVGLNSSFKIQKSTKVRFSP